MKYTIWYDINIGQAVEVEAENIEAAIVAANKIPREKANLKAGMSGWHVSSFTYDKYAAEFDAIDYNRRMATNTWNWVKNTWGSGDIAIDLTHLTEYATRYNTTVQTAIDMGYFTLRHGEWYFINQYPICVK